MRFYLGTHEPHWIQKARGPCFISARRLRRGHRLIGKGHVPWALDSGGFSELSMFGAWKTDAKTYAREVSIWSTLIGGFEWAAVQDWMCEPFILAKTGLDVAEHQIRTIRSYYDLSALAGGNRWLPVLQGFTRADYLRHLRDYQLCGIDLRNVPLVGIGSICRRQGTKEAEEIVRELYDRGIRLHGFGFKLTGLVRCAPYLTSADSMAWSFAARRNPPIAGHTHKTCANCFEYAEAWRTRVEAAIAVGEGESPKK